MIKLVDLTKIYNSGESVGIGIHNVNLEFKVGEFVAIVGSSGSGKTTLLNIVSGMDTYTEGEMFVNGESTANFDSNDLENYRRGNVAFIFQNYNLIDSYTVLENVMVELILKGFDQKSAKSKAKELLIKVGMGERINHRATKLSGGEKQRVVIARALASDAKILACDEPTGNLDTKNTKEIMALIKEVAADKLVLFVTHDESLIEGNATRVIKIRDGKVESDTTLIKTQEYDETIVIPERNSLKTKLYIAMKNLTRTPKKTSFVFLVFMILSFVILFSIAYIPLEMMATKNREIEFKMFENRDENRIVVYTEEAYNTQNSFENGYIFSDDYLHDCFYRATSTTPDLNKYLKKKANLKITKDDLTLKAGRFPEDSATNEIVVILEDSFSIDFYEKILEEETKIRFATDNSTGSFFSVYYKVVGFASCETLEKDVSKFYMNYLGAVNFYASLKERIVMIKDSTTFETDFSLLYNNQRKNVIISDSLEPNEVRINFKLEDEDFILYLGLIPIDLSSYDVKYVYDSVNATDIKISFDAAIRMMEESNYRMSYYVENENLATEIETLTANTMLTCFPLSQAKRVIPIYDFMSIFENLFNFIFIFVEIIASMFIAILITSFILGTKKKELGVLRVIGLSENDVLHVLNLEVLTIMFFSVAVNLLVASRFIGVESDFSYAIIYNNLGKLIFSIVLLFLMAIFISYKWNKSMFKKTAREVLKAGD